MSERKRVRKSIPDSMMRNYALSTLLLLKQEVQTYIFLAAPFSVLTLTDLMLDFHILFDLLCE